MVLTRAIASQTFANVVWQGIVLGTILGKMRPRKNLIRNMLKSDGTDRGYVRATFANMVW